MGKRDSAAAADHAAALPKDASRELMMRRQAGLPLAARIDLFEALSRDAAWARSAVRIR